MKKYLLVKLSLTQSLIINTESCETTVNSVVAICDSKVKKVMIRPEVGHALFEIITNILFVGDMPKDYEMIVGDGFGVDSWNNKLYPNK